MPRTVQSAPEQPHSRTRQMIALMLQREAAHASSERPIVQGPGTTAIERRVKYPNEVLCPILDRRNPSSDAAWMHRVRTPMRMILALAACLHFGSSSSARAQTTASERSLRLAADELAAAVRAGDADALLRLI